MPNSDYYNCYASPSVIGMFYNVNFNRPFQFD